MINSISHITEGTVSADIGLEKGDVILSINDHPIRDVIDLMYFARDTVLDIKVNRNGKEHSYKIRKKESEPLGIAFKPFRTRTCRNKCMFCFVNQLPKGLRKTLYLKDDDYRMSFLFGNYITLTNLSSQEKKRIIEQRLSPLYISVHTTNNKTRRKLLGNPKAPDILREIEDFASHKIRMHAQIVVCPGINDGEELKSTIRDLQKFYPYVASIAVVPVGLTKFQKGTVKPVQKEDAIAIVEIIKNFRKRLTKRHGDPIVYLADEFYLRAGLPFPPLKDYGDLPQIENGVGLVPDFLAAAKQIKLPRKIEPRKIAVFTGTSFYPYLEEFAAKLRAIEGLLLDVIRVENRFFGTSVTVAGLLTGKDIVKAIVGRTDAECLLVPNVALRGGTDVFLDNVSLKDMEEILGIKVKPIEATPQGLLGGIFNGCKRED